jgi:protein Tob/BTG
MLAEVDSAVTFLAKILSNTNMDTNRMDSFKEVLQLTLVNHYQNHWFPEKPFKGSGYRCIRIVNHKMDPLVAQAGACVGLSEEDLLNILPREFTLWVDPNEVSYRIGEEGSIGVLFGDEVDSSDSSDDSRTPSPPIVITAPDDATLAQLQSQEFLQQQCRQQHYRASSPSGSSRNWGEYISNYC